MAKAVDTSRISQRAGEAADKGNHDYAIALYLDVLRANPEDIKSRMALRNVEKAKFEKKRGTGKTISAAIAGAPNILGAALASLMHKPDSAVQSYEKYLTRNPFSPTVLWLLGRAFEKTGRDESAIVTYEFLRQTSPKHIKSLRQLARMYAARKDIQRAMQRYQMLLQLNPRDEEGLKQVHNLAATESIQEGWDKGESFQDKIRDKEKSVRLEQAQKTVRTTAEATDAVTRVKREIEEAPDKPALWAELGDLHRRKGELDVAEEAYNKAIELDPHNQLYLQKLMDTQLAGYERRVEAARAAAAADPSDAALRQAADEAHKERDRFWMSELKRRVEERPTETGLRFELGNIYFQTGMINEATAEFQRVVRDAKYRTTATTMLGKCFAAKGLDDLAIGQFEKALQETSILDSNGKDLAYALGGLYEKVGNLAAAEEMYKKIFETDIGYLDIADRMERVYKKRREENNASN